MKKDKGKRSGYPGCRVLVVDDVAQNRYMLETLLRAEGIEAVSAKNGIEALQVLKSDRISGIISDILMPGMDGFLLIRECKKDPALRNIPFLFYTATYTEKKDEEFGLSLGAIRYIIKPSEPDVLFRLIKEAFAEHARSPRDYNSLPVPDEETFTREYTSRVGAKLEKRERALKESEHKYRELFDNVNDAVFIHELTAEGLPGRLIEVNRAACESLQYTREELLGLSMMDVMTEKPTPEVDEIRHRIKRDGSAFFEAFHRRKDGSNLPVEVRTHKFVYRGRTVAIASARDITERTLAEAMLQESEAHLREAQRIAKIGSWTVNLRDNSIRWSDEMYHIYGVKKEEFPHTMESFMELLHPDDKPLMERWVEQTIQKLKPEALEFRAVLPGGIEHYIRGDGELVTDPAGNPERMVGTAQDITVRREMECTLRESEEKYRLLFQNSIDAILLTSVDGSIQTANPAACAMFQQPEEEILRNGRSLVVDTTDPRLPAALEERERTGHFKGELTFLKKDGTRFPGEISSNIFTDRTGQKRSSMIIRDVSERKRAEEKLKHFSEDLEKQVAERTEQLDKSLHEKEILLKEIHHRVKNNLQIIASLLNLQSQYIKDEKTLAVIKDSQNRIKTMALIHEKIYQSKSLDRIDYGDYLEKITRSLFESYGISPKKIAIKIDAKNIILHIDKAIPCSLIINELLSNSFKHAFPNDRTGEIRVDVRHDGDKLRLVYSDNGVGLPESVTLDHTESLGMRLISGLVQQLKGTVEIRRGEGTTFVITFNV